MKYLAEYHNHKIHTQYVCSNYKKVYDAIANNTTIKVDLTIQKINLMTTDEINQKYQSGYTLLDIACSVNNITDKFIPIIQALLAKGASINTTNNGKTVLELLIDTMDDIVA